jgi:hypothetical protein
VQRCAYPRRCLVPLIPYDFGLQARLVKQEQQAIDAQYEKKRKGAEVAQKMYVVIAFLPYVAPS